MDTIDWKVLWQKAIKNKLLFPSKLLSNNSISVACPTRFSVLGKFSIEVTPSFNDNDITLKMLLFNDNVTINDIKFNKDVNDKNIKFNALADNLSKYQLSNRIVENFTIKSSDFKSEDDAINALVEFINEKATESGHMFDDKLDELNNDVDIANESCKYTAESIRNQRRFILKKIESILNTNYKWSSLKNESFDDSVVSLYDENNNLAAVVSLIDGCVIVDIAKNICAKVNVMQSDEDIESELVSDIDTAKDILADDALANQEIEQMKDAVDEEFDDFDDDDFDDDDFDDDLDDDFDDYHYYESLSRRLNKLESLYIHNRLNNYM